MKNVKSPWGDFFDSHCIYGFCADKRYAFLIRDADTFTQVLTAKYKQKPRTALEQASCVLWRTTGLLVIWMHI